MSDLQKPLYSLQILRGFAAIIVLVAHANLLIDEQIFNGLFIPGWCGVDFFFVLSGFIIFYTAYKYISQPQYALEYFKKRFIRIYPIYWFYSILVLLFNFLIFIIFSKNFITWLELDLVNIIKVIFLYPTNVFANEMPILPVAWTLTYEMCFYLMFGLLILYPLRISSPLIMIWFILIFLNSIGLLKFDNLLLITLFSSKNIEFFLGCAIAYITKHNIISAQNKNLLLLSFFGCIIILIYWYNCLLNYQLFPKNDVLFLGLPFFVILLNAVLYEKDNDLSMNKCKYFLVFFGDASYSIYLIHFPLIVILKQILLKLYISNSYFLFIIIVPLTIMISCFAYKFIEKPFVDFLRNIVSKKNIKRI